MKRLGRGTQWMDIHKQADGQTCSQQVARYVDE